MDLQTKKEPVKMQRKHYISLIVVLIIMTIAVPMVIFLNPVIRGMSARSKGEPVQCIAVDMHTKSEFRSFTPITVFETPDGSYVEAVSSSKDYVGRRTTLLVYGKEAGRLEYEMPKLTAGYYIMIIIVPLMWAAILYCRITKKFTIDKG